MRQFVVAAALAGPACLAAGCAQAQPRGPAVAELYAQATRLAVSAEEAEQALAAARGRQDIAAGMAAIMAGPAGDARPSALPKASAPVIAPASAPAASRR